MRLVATAAPSRSEGVLTVQGLIKGFRGLGFRGSVVGGLRLQRLNSKPQWQPVALWVSILGVLYPRF